MQLRASLDRLLFTIDSALSDAQLARTPFPHFTIPKLFDDVTAGAMLDWLEQEAPWAVETSKFYTQHGCDDIVQRVVGTKVEAIGTPEVFHLISSHLERIFGTALSRNRFRLGAHRMVQSHRIGIHTDNPSGGTETHRLVLTFNRGFDDSYGGQLALIGLDDPSENLVIVPPLHGAATAMELSANSWHCVAEVMVGTRYSLLYSFWSLESESRSNKTQDSDVAIRTGDVSAANDEFEGLGGFLLELGADRIPHTGRFLLDHLAGTRRILHRWECDGDVCKAGLFHSVLGTPSVPHSLMPEAQIDSLRAVIGERALFLVRLFSSLDSPTFQRIIADGEFSDNGVTATLDVADVRALVSLTWANTLEQFPRVPQSSEERDWLKGLYRQTQHLLPVKSQDDIREMLAAV